MDTKTYRIISMKQLPFGTLARIGFAANLGFWLLIGLFMGAGAWMDFDTVSFNGAYIYGPTGAVVAFIFAAIAALFGTIATVVGLMVIRPFVGRPLFDVEIDEAAHDFEDESSETDLRPQQA